MTLPPLTTTVAVEEVRAGDQVVVSRTIGARPVLRVEKYAPNEADRRERFVVVYESTGPGAAWENRGVTSYRREEASLTVRPSGALVVIAARGGSFVQLALDVRDEELDGLSWDEWFRSLGRGEGELA